MSVASKQSEVHNIVDKQEIIKVTKQVHVLHALSKASQCLGACADWTSITVVLEFPEVKENNIISLPACCDQLASVLLTSMNTILPVNETTSMAYTGPQSPHDYGTG